MPAATLKDFTRVARHQPIVRDSGPSPRMNMVSVVASDTLRRVRGTSCGVMHHDALRSLPEGSEGLPCVQRTPLGARYVLHTY